LVSGNTDHINVGTINATVDRYNTLRTHKYAIQLRELYRISDDENDWVSVALRSPHAMESTIMNLDNIPGEKIISTLGIVVPLSHSDDISGYIHDNIISYARIFNRDIKLIPLEAMVFMGLIPLTDYISQLTDKEIFANIGVYVKYTSRVELVSKIVESITQSNFMYPTVRSVSRSTNKATVLGTEITDNTTFMVCYGTALKYTSYELSELIGSFYRDDDTGATEFRRPENIRNKFKLSEIESLAGLLRCFPPSVEITQLLDRIDAGTIDARDKIAHDSTARRNLNDLGGRDKQLVRDFLLQIVYIGMYMRRWKGPGNDFPLDENATKGLTDPNDKVSQQLGIGFELLNQMDIKAKILCMSLKICQYDTNGNIEHGTIIFNTEWEGIITGDRCIRMASTKLIGTGCHYLKALFRETIPGLIVNKLDHIM